MTTRCEWCAKHRDTLRKMEDDIIAMRRGSEALELLVGAGEFDPSEGIKFMASQLHEIADRLDDTFSQWGLHEPEGEEKHG